MKTVFLVATFIVIGVFYFKFDSKFLMNLAAFMLFLSLLLGIFIFLFAGFFFKALAIIVFVIATFMYLNHSGFGKYVNTLYDIGIAFIHTVSSEIAYQTSVGSVCVWTDSDSQAVCGDEEDATK